MKNKQIKQILSQINSQFNCGIKNEYLFLINSKRDRVYIASPEIQKVDLKKLRVNNIGLYFGTIERDGFRLTIEGTELLDNPKKNVIELNKEQFEVFMHGEDLEIEEDPGYKIIKYKNKFLGSAKLSKNVLYNYTPKQRRAKENL